MDGWITTITILISVDALVAIVPFLFYCYSPYFNYPALIHNWTNN
jgi:hypothetical protein